uniref:sphingomyelin phosphodiesterase n=1 Tax=Gallus gallus TaxID=9031 RepID=A0A8V0X7P1_CHICK
MLPTPLFPTRAVAALNAVAQALLFPAAFTLNLLLDLRPTTAQRRLRCRWVDVAARAALGSLLAVLLLLAMPAAVVGLLLWLPAQRARRPFAYSCWVPEGPAMPWDGRRRREFTFVSANVCLLPSGLAKFSNLGQTGSRARFLASSLVPQCPTDRQPLVGSGDHGGGGAGDAGGWGYGGTQMERRGDGGGYGGYGGWGEWGGQWVELGRTQWGSDGGPNECHHGGLNGCSRGGPNGCHHGGPNGCSHGGPNGAAPMDKDTPKDSTSATPRHRDPLQPTFLGSSPQLWERFPPDADFVCLQEVFDPMAEAVLCRQLGLRYPHVFHGVGAGGLHDGGLKLLGSGLLVAARYPPLAASFYCYPNGAGEDALAAKGLLCIQVRVLLGSQDGRRVLGYLSCTHLQAPERDTAVRSEQLRAALRWGRHFREQHTNTGDVVAFDVLCGDLNFDNCSHGGGGGGGNGGVGRNGIWGGVLGYGGGGGVLGGGIGIWGGGGEWDMGGMGGNGGGGGWGRGWGGIGIWGGWGG